MRGFNVRLKAAERQLSITRSIRNKKHKLLTKRVSLS